MWFCITDKVIIFKNVKFIFTACNENSSLQCRNPEIKLRDGDDQRPQLYFKLYFLTATSLFLKGLLALIKILITPGRYSKITLHLLFSVHTGLMLKQSLKKTQMTLTQGLSHHSPKSHIRVLGTVCQSYSHLKYQEWFKYHYYTLTNQV